MSSRRSRPLPQGWQRKRARVLRRDDGVCHVCGQPGADEVDHVIPASQGGTDEMDNLAAIHGDPCHRNKTAAEASAGIRRRRREPEKHPGML